MRCTDRLLGVRFDVRLAGSAVLSMLAACSSPEPSPSPPLMAPSLSANTGSQARQPADSPAPRASGTPVAPALPAPAPVRNWNELRRQAALRMVAANPAGTYTGEVVEPLLAIPVLEIELNRDGSINRILILREPHEARDTTPLAVAAVRRSAPFGDVSRLPKPWRFTETFLFNDDRKFKPRTLDP